MVADFAIYKDEDRQTYLAYFYERLARHLLHMKPIAPDAWLSKRGTEHFDLADEHLCTYVEVKGASNTDQLKLFEDQLQMQLGELCFPIEDAILLIFSYKNRETTEPLNRLRSRLLKRGSGKSWKELSQFLAEHTNVAFAIDLRMIELLYQQKGTRRYSRDRFNERHRVNISRTDLRLLTKDARTTLGALGLSEEELARWLPPRAHAIRPRTVETVFDGNRVCFDLFAILPNGKKQRFLKRLNGNIKK